MESIPIISAITGVLGLFGGKKGGEQQQQPQATAPAQPEQAPQSQASKTPGAAVFQQQNMAAEGPDAGGAGSTLLTSNDLGAGLLGKSKTLGG